MPKLRAKSDKWMVAFLLLASLLVGSTLTSADVRAQDETTQVGVVRLIADEAGPVAGYVLTLEAMPDAPDGSHFELWATLTDADPIYLDTLIPEDGGLLLEAELGDDIDPLAGGFGIAISIEPDDDPEPDSPNLVVISSALPAEFGPLLHTLLIDDGVNDAGALTSALEQAGTAYQHTGFISDSVASGNLTGARNHAEHVINTLDGDGGMFFGDLNRDGQAQNPGDGYGVRAYVADAKSSAQELLDNADLDDEARSSLLQAVTALDDAQALVGEAREQATKLYAIDTADEAAAVVEALDTALTELSNTLSGSDDAFLSLVSLPLLLDPASIVPPVVLENKGNLQIQGAMMDDGAMQASGYELTLEAMPDAPDGSHFELWATFTDADPIYLDTLIPEDGALLLEAELSDDIDPLAGGFGIAISIEPDDDPEPGFPNFVVISSTLSAEFGPLLHTLLIDDGINDAGVLTNALGQASTAHQHTGFISDSVASGNLSGARNHAEHVVNILDGEGGLFFGDLNRDGQAQNPGDGYGVRAYVADAKSSVQELLDNADLDDEARTSLLQAVTALDDAQALVGEAREQATKLYAIDTADEAAAVVEALNAALTKLSKTITGSGSDFFSLASFPLLLDRAIVFEEKEVEEEVAVDTEEEQPAIVDTEPTTETVSASETGMIVMPPPPHAQAGDTWTNPADGSVYVYVPGGEYSIGSEDDGASSREAPEHTVSVDGFWIQQTETTNEQFARCVADGACTEPDNDRWNPAPSATDTVTESDTESITESDAESDANADFTQHPVANVSWEQAQAYADWAGVRLPSETEWEIACRGADDNLYPWGELPPSPQLGNYDDAIEDTVPVGSYPDGAAPFGALDMAGNVWEWTASLDAAYPYDAADGREDLDAEGKRIMRGGSFYYNAIMLRCSARTGVNPTTQIPHLGFRTALSGNQ